MCLYRSFHNTQENAIQNCIIGTIGDWYTPIMATWSRWSKFLPGLELVHCLPDLCFLQARMLSLVWWLSSIRKAQVSLVLGCNHCTWHFMADKGSLFQRGGCPGVPVHEGIPFVFITIHGVMTQFVNVSFLCVPVHEDTTQRGMKVIKRSTW